MKWTVLPCHRVKAPARAVIFLVAAAALAGCSSEAATPRPAGDTDTLATVGGTPVTLADIRQRLDGRLDQLDNQYRQQRHQLIETALEQVLRDRLLEDEADARGMTVDELVSAEVTDKVDVTDADIVAWYKQNKERLPGRSLQEVYPSIEGSLRRGRQDQLRDGLIQELRQERKVEVYLDPFRVQLDNAGSPALGPATAPITLVEFSDFECPFCSRFSPTVGRLEEHYGDQLRIVYRQFPLSNIHPRAMKAAEASLCAHDQERFWEMHDLLFEQQDRLGVEALKEVAGRLELDQAAFDECLDSGRHADQVLRDFRAGQIAGVGGTPALFVNGIRVPGGAVPYETVAQAIDEELERVKKQ